MRRFALMLCLAIGLPMASRAQSASPPAETVHGYTKKSGTVVAPHKRSVADETKKNNYSTKGNSNPYTGKMGTKNITPSVKAPRASKAPRVSAPRASTRAPKAPRAPRAPRTSRRKGR